MEINKEMDWDEYIDHLIDIMQSIELDRVTILTGRNGGGKSMIRKILPSIFMGTDGEDVKVASISMDFRAGLDDSRMSVFDRDLEWLPTSENTFSSIEQVLHQKNRFIVLDELELGMGEELQAGLAMWINSYLKEHMKDTRGVLVITHSRTMVKNLDSDNFINLEGLTKEEWLNREVVPMSPDDLMAKSNALRFAFEKRLKKK